MALARACSPEASMPSSLLTKMCIVCLSGGRKTTRILAQTRRNIRSTYDVTTNRSGQVRCSRTAQIVEQRLEQRINLHEARILFGIDRGAAWVQLREFKRRGDYSLCFRVIGVSANAYAADHGCADAPAFAARRKAPRAVRYIGHDLPPDGSCQSAARRQ